MTLIDVIWTPEVNLLAVNCLCGLFFFWPSNYSVVRCPACRREKLWHGVDPKPEEGPWSLPEMENKVLMCCELAR